MRWDHCNELLLAMRQSVKECNPKILDAVIQKQKEDLDANPGMTGPFRQSRLHRSTSEVVLRQQTDMELFIQKRDEHRLVRAAEAQKQREWEEMQLQVRNLTDQLAASETARQTMATQLVELTASNQTMSTQITTLTTQMTSLSKKLAKSERTTQILLTRLLAKEGLDATVPEEDQDEPTMAAQEPTALPSSPAANPQSLFAGSPQPVASTAATLPADASQTGSIIHQAEEETRAIIYSS